MRTLMLGWLLVVAGVWAQPPTPKTSPEERYAALLEDVRRDVESWRQAQRDSVEEAQKSNKPLPALSMIPPLARFIPVFETAADEYRSTEGAVSFLVWIALEGHRMGQKEAVARALGTLAEHHLKSARLGELPGRLPILGHLVGEERVMHLLERLESENPSADVRAVAVLAQVQKSLTEAPLRSEEYQTARRRVVAARGLATDAALRARIDGMLNRRERLEKGQVAPDVVGIDLDGVLFRLSDYKGKIILLDFWGDW